MFAPYIVIKKESQGSFSNYISNKEN